MIAALLLISLALHTASSADSPLASCEVLTKGCVSDLSNVAWTCTNHVSHEVGWLWRTNKQVLIMEKVCTNGDTLTISYTKPFRPLVTLKAGCKGRTKGKLFSSEEDLHKTEVYHPSWECSQGEPELKVAISGKD